jgi:hypothetical protein
MGSTFADVWAAFAAGQSIFAQGQSTFAYVWAAFAAGQSTFAYVWAAFAAGQSTFARSVQQGKIINNRQTVIGDYSVMLVAGWPEQKAGRIAYSADGHIRRFV